MALGVGKKSSEIKSNKFTIYKIIKLTQSKSAGSLIPLSFGFFLITLSLLFMSININAAYATKKELINIGEGAIQKSAQELDYIAYYLELNRFNFRKSVPINCISARNKFYNLISQVQISRHDIHIQNFDCNLFSISAEISVSGQYPIKIPLLNSITSGQIEINAVVGANSPYQLS